MSATQALNLLDPKAKKNADIGLAVVVVSIIGQGLTIGRVLRRSLAAAAEAQPATGAS